MKLFLDPLRGIDMKEYSENKVTDISIGPDILIVPKYTTIWHNTWLGQKITTLQQKPHILQQ